MKTAQVPNSPSLEKLMVLSAELSVVQDDLDKWHQSEINDKLREIIDLNFDAVKEEFNRLEIVDYDEKFIRQCVAYSALSAAEVITTHVKLMERNLGLVTPHSPGELAHQAYEGVLSSEFKHIATYWDQV